MNRIVSWTKKSGYALVLAGCMTSLAIAADVSGGGELIIIGGLPSGVTQVRMTGPEGYAQTNTDGRFTAVGGFADGQYNYEVEATAAGSTALQNSYKATLDNGRGKTAKPKTTVSKTVDSGVFRVQSGSVIEKNSQTEN